MNFSKSKEALLLDWFAMRFNTPVSSKRVILGSHSYFRCFSANRVAGESFLSTGRGRTIDEAAIKCVAEYLERIAFLKLYASGSEGETGSCAFLNDGSLLIKSNPVDVYDLPRPFITSNGWAVHFSIEKAIENAYLELIERHCLILSFLKYGWGGFELLNEMTFDGTRFLSLLSKVIAGGFQAAMVLGFVPETGGVSLGHGCEHKDRILQSPKWAHALYESFDKIGTFNKNLKLIGNSIESETQDLMHNPFTYADNLSRDSSNRSSHPIGPASFRIFDLQKDFGCPVPFFAAQVRSKDLIPLFRPHLLSEVDRQWFQKTFQRYGDFQALPERIPIL